MYSVIQRHVQKQKQLLELELHCEAEQQNETNKTNNSTKILNNVTVEEWSIGLMGRTIVTFSSFVDDKKVLLPANRLSVGDPVEIHNRNTTTKNKKKKKPPNGVISVITEEIISIVLSDSINSSKNNNFDSQQDDEDDEDNFFNKKQSQKYSILPQSSVAVHRKYLQSLDELEKYGKDHLVAGSIIQQIFEPKTYPPYIMDDNKSNNMTPFNPHLDSSQLEAIRFVLFGNSSVALIHGPPGTGKTTTVAELIHQAVHIHHKKVLVTAPSNIAVDNILERLVKSKSTNKTTRVVRMGHPARIQSSLLPFSLEALVQDSDGTEIVRNVKDELNQQLNWMTSSSSASSSKRRISGVEKRAVYREIKVLKKEIRQREEKVVQDLLRNAQVVLATNVGASNAVLDKEFDLVIIDEAAQALEASCWIPILKGKQLVLVGDHCQLPPTITSPNAKVQRELGTTLFQQLMPIDGLSRMLQVQYRMHENIATILSNLMYEGKLQSHNSVKARTLFHLPHVTTTTTTTTTTKTQKEEKDKSSSIPFTLPAVQNASLLLIDTSGCDMHESTNKTTGSKFNEGEAELVAQQVRNLCNIGLKPEEIAVITPYNGQVELLRSMLLEEFSKLEIRSVDGFQGCEREAVVLSLVRSSNSNKRGGRNNTNTNGIGFLKDDRRLNVAVSRAKRQCCIICDYETVQQSFFLKQLLNWFEEKGEYLSAMECIIKDEQQRIPFNNDIMSDYKEMLLSLDDEPPQQNPTLNNSTTTVRDTKNSDMLKQCEKGERTEEDNLIGSLKEAECQQQRNELKDQLVFFAEIAENGEEMEVSISSTNYDFDFVSELCNINGLVHQSENTFGSETKIIISKMGALLSQGKDDEEHSVVSYVEECSPLDKDQSIVRNNSVETDKESFPRERKQSVNKNVKVKGELFPAEMKQSPSEREVCDIDNINNLLGSLAKERESRVLEKDKLQKKKTKKGDKVGGPKGKKKKKKKCEDSNLDDLDEMAFLDAQIEKVQSSHGRKIEASGDNYKSIVNGILISKSRPREKVKNERSSTVLKEKIKKAQHNRRAKKKK